MVISEDNKLNVIKDLYVHWNKNYWYSVYIFLIIQGLIILALTEVLKATGNVNNENRILSLFVLLGIIFSILWCLVLNRKFSYIYHSKDKLSLDMPIEELVQTVAEQKKMQLENFTVIMLERDRHTDFLHALRKLGVRIILIPKSFFLKIA